MKTPRLLLFLFLLAACTPDPTAGDFAAPRLGKVTVEAETFQARISCPVSGNLSGISDYGIRFEDPDAIVTSQSVSATLADSVLRAEVKALSPGTTYHAEIYLTNGAAEITQTFTFRTEAGTETVNIPDPVFRRYILANYDYNRDGEISRAEASAVERIDIESDEIATLKGLEYFTNLRYLKCVGTHISPEHEAYGSGILSYLDVTHCPELEELIVYQNQITAIDVSHCPKLRNLHPARNFLTELDLSNNPLLTHLAPDFNLLTEIDVSHCPLLDRLDVSNNELTEIDVSALTALHDLLVRGNQLTNLDVSNNTALKELQCSENNLTEIDLTNNRHIIILFLQDNPLSLPDLSGLDLESLHISELTHDLPADYFRQFPNLISVNFSGYRGAVLDLSQNTKLQDVWAWNINNMPSLNLSASSDLRNLYCSGEQLQYVYVQNGVTFDHLEKDQHTQIIYQ